MARRKSRRSSSTKSKRKSRRASSNARDKKKNKKKKKKQDKEQDPHPYRYSTDPMYKDSKYVKASRIKDGQVYIKRTSDGKEVTFVVYSHEKASYDDARFKENGKGSAQDLRKKKAENEGGLEAKVNSKDPAVSEKAKKELRAIKKKNGKWLAKFFGKNWQSFKGWVDKATLDYIHNNYTHDTIVDRTRPVEPVDYSGDHTLTEHERMYKENMQYAAGIRKPGLISKVKNLFRMLTMMGPQNAFDITAGKFIVDKHNAKTMANLKEGDNVLVLLHGYHQNGGAFRRYIKEAEAKGYKVIAPTYDYKMPAKWAAHEMWKFSKAIQEKTLRRVSIYGHSTGGNNTLAYLGNHPSAKLYTASAIAGAPTTNGLGKPLTYAHLLFPGGIPKVDNPKYKEGRENIALINKPESGGVPYIVMAGSDDDLVPAENSIAKHAWQNSVYVDINHFDGAGGHVGVIRENLKDLESLGQVETLDLSRGATEYSAGQAKEMITGCSNIANEHRPHREKDVMRSDDNSVISMDVYRQRNYVNLDDNMPKTLDTINMTNAA